MHYMNHPITGLFTALLMMLFIIWRNRKHYKRGYDDALNHMVVETKSLRLFVSNTANGPVLLNGAKHFYLSDVVELLRKRK